MRQLLLLASVLALISAGCLDEPTEDSDFVGRELAGNPAPLFNLTDQDNNSFELASLKGKVVGLTFLYASCPDVCPLVTAYMKAALELLGDDYPTNVEFLGITVDPARDDPANLSAFATGRDLPWPFLTGPFEELLAVWNAYGIVVQYPPEAPYHNHTGHEEEARHGGESNETEEPEGNHTGHQGYEVGHAVLIYLIDGEGNLRVMLPGLPPTDWTAEDLAHDIRLLLEEL